MHEPIRTEKKPWQKPELIVMVRSKPEELVLMGCKWGTYGLELTSSNPINGSCKDQYCWTCDVNVAAT